MVESEVPNGGKRLAESHKGRGGADESAGEDVVPMMI